jgi:hypothetical protein
MANIKKAYAEIVSLLQDNENEYVRDILPSVIEIASAKQGGGGGKASTFHKDEEGNVVAIRCYYFGLWMDPAVVEFGKKASSATGFNSMCKEGSSHWTKQQRDAKKAKEQLLTDLANGDVEASDLPNLMDEIEEAKSAVAEPSDNIVGYETLEELLEAREA